MARSQLVIDLGEELGGFDVVGDVASLDRKPGRAQDLRGRAKGRPQEGVRHDRAVVDRHEVARAGVQVLEGDEVERAIPDDGSTGRAPELLLAERSLLLVDRHTERVHLLEMPLRVEGIVAKEDERVPAQLIGPALGHDVQNAAGRLAELRRIRVGEHLELAHGLLAEGGSHRAQGHIVVVEPVHGDVVGPRPLAGEGETGGGRGALLRRAIGVDARRDHGERHEVPAVDRQTLDLLLRDDRRHCRPLRVHQGRGTDDGDGLGGCRHAEREGQVHTRPEQQHKALPSFSGETRERDRHVVGSRLERRNHEPPVLTRSGRPGLVGGNVGGRDHGARKHRLGRIANDTGEVGGGGACLRSGPHRCGERCPEQ